MILLLHKSLVIYLMLGKNFMIIYPDQEEFIYQKNYELQDKKGRDMDFDLQAKIVFKRNRRVVFIV